MPRPDQELLSERPRAILRARTADSGQSVKPNSGFAGDEVIADHNHELA